MVIRFMVDPRHDILPRDLGREVNPIEVALKAGGQIPHYVDQMSLDEAQYEDEYLAQIITWPIEPFMHAWHAHDPESLLTINAVSDIFAP